MAGTTWINLYRLSLLMRTLNGAVHFASYADRLRYGGLVDIARTPLDPMNIAVLSANRTA